VLLHARQALVHKVNILQPLEIHCPLSAAHVTVEHMPQQAQQAFVLCVLLEAMAMKLQ